MHRAFRYGHCRRPEPVIQKTAMNGHTLHSALHSALLAMVLAASAVVAFTHLRCQVAGDAQVLVYRGILVRTGYVSENLAAWRQGDAAAHRRLNVEGGFPFAVALLSALHPLSPFLINIVLWPVILALAWAWSVRGGNTRPVPEWMTAGWLIFMWTLPALRESFVVMCQPLRDPLAFALILGSWAWMARGTAGWRSALGSGLCVGLSLWVRLPMAAVVPASGLGVLALPGPARLRVRRAFAWSLGLALGLLPMLGQNILEGRVSLSPPSGDLLLMTNTPMASNADISLGWHPKNARYLAPAYARGFANALPWWVHVLALGAVVGGIRGKKWAAPELWAAAAAVSLVLFYGGYCRYIPRYLSVSLWLTSALAALGAARAGIALVRRVKPAHGPAAIPVLMAVGVAGSGYAASGRLGDARAEWRAPRQFRPWIEQHIPKGSRMITYSPALRLWVDIFGSGRDIKSVWWKAPPTEHTGDPAIRSAMQEGRSVYWASLLDDQGRPRPSWWEDALRHEYAFSEPPLQLSEPRAWVYRLLPFTENPRRGALPDRPASGGWLVWGLREGVDSGATPATVQFSGAGAPSESMQLAPGLHIIPWKTTPAGDGHASPRWSSDVPLASSFRAEWADPSAPIVVEMHPAHRVPSLSRFLNPASILWRGYRNIERDVGAFYELEKFKSWAGFLVMPELEIRLPQYHAAEGTGNGRVVLTYALIVTDRKGIPPPEDLFTYTAAGRPVDFASEGRRKLRPWGRTYTIFFRHSMKWPDAPSLKVNVSGELAAQYLMLWKMEFFPPGPTEALGAGDLPERPARSDP